MGKKIEKTKECIGTTRMDQHITDIIVLMAQRLLVVAKSTMPSESKLTQVKQEYRT